MASTAAAAASSKSSMTRARKNDVFVAHLDASGELVLPEEEEKSLPSLRAIFSALNSNVFFQQLGEIEYDLMARAMRAKQCTKGEVLIKQGDTKADLFYVVEKGHFDFLVDGKVVGEGRPGSAFGELALLYNSPRAATVVASEDALVWYLHRDLFRRIVTSTVHRVRQEIQGVLRTVPLVKQLSEDQIIQVCDIVQTHVTFKAGETIITKGDTGSVFYIIMSGTAVCTEIGNTSDTLELHQGDYFGERAIMKSEPRIANVIAKTSVSCITIQKADFDRHFGPLIDILHKNLGTRVLKSLSILSNLDPIQKDKLIEECTEKTYEDGEYIVRQGDRGDAFYIITEGSAEVYKKSEESGDKPVHITTLNVGDYFGEGALLKDEPRGADIQAKGLVKTYVLDRETFDCFFNKIKGHINQRFSVRLDQTDDALKKRALDLEKKVQLADLVHLRTLGTGTFGRVKLVESKTLAKTFALKILQKSQVISFSQEINVINERMILAECNHPFILHLGGELFSVLHVHLLPHVKDPDAMFYVACVVDIFEYLHDRTIVYRDLKPENLMIDNAGYIKMVDFGFAKKITDKTFTLCGTPEYLSPEILLSTGHNKGSDYWALGILTFEILTRRCPFADRDRMIMYENILSGDVEFPDYYGADAKDLTQQLLIKEPHLRLGNLKNGVRDIKNHVWFTSRDLDFNELRRKRITAPWVPKIKDPRDVSNFDNYSEDFEVEPYTGGQGWDEDF